MLHFAHNSCRNSLWCCKEKLSDWATSCSCITLHNWTNIYEQVHRRDESEIKLLKLKFRKINSRRNELSVKWLLEGEKKCKWKKFLFYGETQTASRWLALANWKWTRLMLPPPRVVCRDSALALIIICENNEHMGACSWILISFSINIYGVVPFQPLITPAPSQPPSLITLKSVYLSTQWIWVNSELLSSSIYNKFHFLSNCSFFSSSQVCLYLNSKR